MKSKTDQTREQANKQTNKQENKECEDMTDHRSYIHNLSRTKNIKL